MLMQPFLYEILIIDQVRKPNESTMQVKNVKMHKYAKNKIFLYFWNKWYVKATKESPTLRLCNKSHIGAKQDTEIK